MKDSQIQHLYWRAGFGIGPKQMALISGKSKAEIIDLLFKQSLESTPLTIDLSELKDFSVDMFAEDKANRKDFMKISRKKVVSYNTAWVERLFHTQELLREKMTLFWANHFVVKENNVVFVQQYNNMLRKHALGNFGAFVKAVSKEPAMIKYLNNKQNKKQHPNENFARELMELFTLGAGNYTEEDIKESARAFTGYNHDFEGNFKFRKNQHDGNMKMFLGESGPFDGDDVINIILKKKQCARFVCEKIYKYFVNDEINNSHIDQMVNVFFPNYEIETLMRFVFSSEWFYETDNIGTKIKSPVELLVGIKKVVPFELKNKRDLLKIQKLLGQVLLYPPNVAGWKGGKSWIDSNTIMLRLRLASVLLNNASIPHEILENSPEFSIKNSKRQPFKAHAEWTEFDNAYQGVALKELKRWILEQNINEGTVQYINELNKSSKRDVCLQLMSLPEYQMC